MTKEQEYNKKWKSENSDHIKAYNKAYRIAHADEIKLRESSPEYRAKRLLKSKNYYSKNKHKIDKDKKREYLKQWSIKNRDSLLKSKAAWRDKNRDKIKGYSKRYFDSNQDACRSRNAQWRARVGKEYFQDWDSKNPGKRTAYSNTRRARLNGATFDDSAKAFYAFVKNQEFVECSYCGKIVSGKSSHIDHLIALSKGGFHVASNLRVSCQFCNLSKHDKDLSEWKPELVGKI